jgi:hypothetical protein
MFLPSALDELIDLVLGFMEEELGKGSPGWIYT